MATELGVPFLYASSAATYGDGALGYNDDHDGLFNLKALNPYGFSKHLFDQWILEEHQAQRPLPPKWYGLKFFNVFGPHEYHKGKMRSVVHAAFEQIKASGEVKLFMSHREDYKNGQQLRDFIYVKDIVTILLAFFEGQAQQGIYNVGTGKARSFEDLALAVFKAMDLTPKIQYIPMPLELRERYQYFTQADTSKLLTNLPSLTFSTLEESITNYIQTFLNSSDPYLGRGNFLL